MLLFASRFPHSGPLRHRRRRVAAAGPEQDLGGAGRAGPRRDERREASRADPRRHRALGRQRWPEHGRPVWRRRVLSRQAEPGDSGEAGHQDRRRLRIPPVDGRLRAALQGRPDGGRARLRLRPSEPVALFVDGVLAHGRAERRRAARMAGPAGRCGLRPGDAQHDRQPGELSVAGGAKPQAFAAGVRRSRALPARRHGRRESRPWSR